MRSHECPCASTHRPVHSGVHHVICMVLHCPRVDFIFKILAKNDESCCVCRISQPFRNVPIDGVTWAELCCSSFSFSTSHALPALHGRALQPGKETAKMSCWAWSGVDKAQNCCLWSFLIQEWGAPGGAKKLQIWMNQKGVIHTVQKDAEILAKVYFWC